MLGNVQASMRPKMSDLIVQLDRELGQAHPVFMHDTLEIANGRAVAKDSGSSEIADAGSYSTAINVGAFTANAGIYDNEPMPQQKQSRYIC